MEAFIPVVIMFVLALLLSGAIYFITSVLGPRVRGRIKLSPYECGVYEPAAQTSTKLPFQFRFYLIAVIFLLFDVEGAFFLPWALIYRESLAVDGTLLVGMLVFSFFVVLGLVYVFRNKYLNVD